MERITTRFAVIAPIFMPVTVGGGWNARTELLKKAAPGDILVCSTRQTTACLELDSSVQVTFPDGIETHSFENLGRWIACGAIKQVDI